MAMDDYPFHDDRDAADADRGFVARARQRTVTTSDGRTVWDLDAYVFLDAAVPGTVDPSLWRQSGLLARDGLYEVVPGVYQVRGYDLSVMTVVEGGTGVVVIDPLTSKEVAAAAMALYREHRGDRPVLGMVYTHSHIDHFGGVKGVLGQAEVDAGVPVIAPQGFLEHAVSENVFAGTAMARRAAYMYGALLAKGPAGQVGAGLGQTTSAGEPTLIAPTLDITVTGQEVTVDGVRMVFQLTPGTEAPAELNLYLPGHRALCAAENATHTMHNLLTLRGAQVRDPRAWADYLLETVDLWGDQLDVVFASHHWPTWGRDRAVEFLLAQSDMYAYLHDQTLRLINQGYVGAEIAEILQMPPALQQQWHTHGYYGSLSHNVKAVYQRYLGWYDGNPAHLWTHPPEAAATRYVEAMGGADRVVELAREAYASGDLRWAAELLDRVLFAGEDHAAARSLQADTLERMGFGAENGTWRNAFLSGATELRQGGFGTPVSADAPDIFAALTVEQLLASLAVRLDGPRACEMPLTLWVVLTDLDVVHLVEVRHGVLVHRRRPGPAPDEPSVTTTRAVLGGLLTGHLALEVAVADGGVLLEGDTTVLGRLLSLVDRVDPDFAIVTP